jgi:hypothetical protein
MTCSFCGLETGSPTSHETQEACIEALRSQVSELRNLLQHTRHPGEDLRVPHDVPRQAAVGAGLNEREGSG